MCPLGYHQNNLVATHAYWHMMCGYTLLVPVNETSAQTAKELCPSCSARFEHLVCYRSLMATLYCAHCLACGTFFKQLF